MTGIREVGAEFVRREVAPHLQEWEDAGEIPRALHLAAAKQGLLGISFPEAVGGEGGDVLDTVDLQEGMFEAGASSGLMAGLFTGGIALPHIAAHGGPDLIERFVRPTLAGEKIGALAITEPGGGSDVGGLRTTAVRDGDHYVVNGAKTFITSGFSSDVVLTAARTGTKDGRPQLSLILVPTAVPGFGRGRKLRKLGLHAQDTAEISFTDVRVPATNLVGEEGRGFAHLTAQLPLERLSIAWRALSAAEAALEWTVRYTKERKAFGQRVIDFQNTRFRLAEMTTEVEITRAFLEQGIFALNAGEFDATLGAKAKWWTTELQNRIINACLQMHGGYGYMDEYPISRAYADARVQTIVGGTTEIMKEIIGRDIAGPVPKQSGV